jgi:hypothetical protein
MDKPASSLIAIIKYYVVHNYVFMFLYDWQYRDLFTPASPKSHEWYTILYYDITMATMLPGGEKFSAPLKTYRTTTACCIIDQNTIVWCISSCGEHHEEN